jgi:hypothetical protein
MLRVRLLWLLVGLLHGPVALRARAIQSSASVSWASVTSAPVPRASVSTASVSTATRQPEAANSGPRLEIALPTATTPMTVRLRDAIDGGRFEELLRSGFDVRVHLTAELWKMGRIFNDVVASAEWDLLLHYDQFDEVYDVARLEADGRVVPLGTYRRLADAKQALALAYAPPVRRPASGARHYYAVRADIETLDLKDLDELTRWLRGELGPAVQGRRNPGTALGRGVRTLVSRVMGGEVRRLEARSPRFTVTGG